jgi:hypothetical protein
MPDPRHRLSLVGPATEDLRPRFMARVGREPTPTELKVFARWRIAVALDTRARPVKKTMRLIPRP